MKTISFFLSMLLLTLTFGCGNATDKSDKIPANSTDAENPKETETAEKSPENASTETTLNGTYSNESGKVIITNYIAEKGFDFKVILKSPEDCAGINYEGKAIFDRDDHAISGEDTFERDEFTFNGKNLKFEPNVAMIGMECSRFVDIEFEKN